MAVTTTSIITLIRGLIKDLLNTNGRNVFQYDTDSSFKLDSNNISSSTILVYLNGTLLDSADWAYNSSTNKVTITPVTSGVSLTKGDNIIITFSFYEKYSDTELTGYIKSNLVWFTKYQYKKTFYMNSSDEVATSNGENPTEEEGNVIAMVTSVDIDPQNVRIQIVGDFSVTPVENKTKSEQILDIFANFGKCYGVVDFLEDED